jgi:hypothetical protein
MAAYCALDLGACTIVVVLVKDVSDDPDDPHDLHERLYDGEWEILRPPVQGMTYVSGDVIHIDNIKNSLENSTLLRKAMFDDKVDKILVEQQYVGQRNPYQVNNMRALQNEVLSRLNEMTKDVTIEVGGCSSKYHACKLLTGHDMNQDYKDKEKDLKHWKQKKRELSDTIPETLQQYFVDGSTKADAFKKLLAKQRSDVCDALYLALHRFVTAKKRTKRKASEDDAGRASSSKKRCIDLTDSVVDLTQVSD